MSALNLYDKSILAIPAYYILSMFPHSYAIQVATNFQPLRWDNRNPRSSVLKKDLQEKLPKEQYEKYERCEAASANGMENLPLFASAIILGKMAALDRGEMEKFAGVYLALRALYFWNYIATKKNEYTLVRSGLWVGSVVLCVRTIMQAAKVLAK